MSKLPMEPEPRETSLVAGGARQYEAVAAGAPPEVEGGGVNLGRLLSAALRHKWSILAVTLAGTAIGGFLGRFAPQSYTAQATIWVENTESNPSGPIQPQGLLSQTTAFIDLMRSSSVLDHVVREKRLYLAPAGIADSAALAGFTLIERFRPGGYQLVASPDGSRYSLRTQDGDTLETVPAGQPIGQELGFAWSPAPGALRAGRALDFEVRAPREATMGLMLSLRPNLDQSGTFLTVALTGNQPQKVADVLNAITERFVAVAAELKRAKLDELTRVLEDQRAFAGANLRSAEMALQEFRVQTITLPSENASGVTPGLASTQDPVVSRFFAMRLEVEQIRQDLTAISRALDGGLHVEALEAIGPVQTSSALNNALTDLTERRAELRTLEYKYTDAYAPVIAAKKTLQSLETETIPLLAQQLQEGMRRRMELLERDIAAAGSELRTIPPRMIEEARLQREVTNAENLYTTLDQRHAEASLAAASSSPDVRILDPATAPSGPLNDSGQRILVLAFFGSLGLGLLGAVLRDRTDPRVRYADQVTSLGLPIVAGLPQVKLKRGSATDQDRNHAIEAFRSLRLAVQHSYGTAGPIFLTVSSTGAGDGKSFVSTNLAVAFADLGRRTLLVDGDIRRGGLQRWLGAGSSKPGITDVLSGHHELAEAVRPTMYAGLSLLPGGTRRADGPELLASARLGELFGELRRTYDVIIVDSPPLGAGADAFILSTATGHLLLVVRTGRTDRQMTEAKLQLVDRLPIRTLGAVLNAVPATREYAYYGYISGYDIEPEVTVQELRVPQDVSGTKP